MRIRTVKPEFHQHEGLAKLPREDRLLAVALLNWADDDGYFKSHPMLIAGALFPFDEDARAFVVRGLAHLAGAGFVDLYENGIGCIPKFSEHQVINKHADSKLKPKAGKKLDPDECKTPVVLPEDSGSPTVALPEDYRTEVEVEVEVEVEQGSGSGKQQEAREPHPFQVLWNANAPPKAPRWTKRIQARNKIADIRTRENPEPDFWPALFKRINASDFLSGRKVGFVVTPDWVLNPTNLNKILEGHYDRNDPPPRGAFDFDQGVISSRRQTDDESEKQRLWIEELASRDGASP